MKFLVTGYLPEDFNPASVTPEIGAAIHQHNAAMEAAGVLVLAGGLAPAKMTKTLRAKDGKMMVTDGPFTETKEQLGGFYILEAASLDDAIAWVSKGAAGALGPIEIRQIFVHEG